MIKPSRDRRNLAKRALYVNTLHEDASELSEFADYLGTAHIPSARAFLASRNFILRVKKGGQDAKA